MNGDFFFYIGMHCLTNGSTKFSSWAKTPQSFFKHPVRLIITIFEILFTEFIFMWNEEDLTPRTHHWTCHVMLVIPSPRIQAWFDFSFNCSSVKLLRTPFGNSQWVNGLWIPTQQVSSYNSLIISCAAVWAQQWHQIKKMAKKAHFLMAL